MSNIETQHNYEVWDNQLGVSLRVGPDAEHGALVEVRAPSCGSKAHFGDPRLVMEPEFALALAQAMIACADDLRKLRVECVRFGPLTIPVVG